MKHSTIPGYADTIGEIMFLARELIGDEAREDRLIVNFYRKAAKEALSAEEISERILRVTHQVLSTDAAYGSGDRNGTIDALADTQTLRTDRTGRLISSYYREKRAAFRPDTARIERLAKEIDAA